MTNEQYQIELMAFDEKIALSELEVTKAEERSKELKYQKAQFILKINMLQMRAKQEAEAAAQAAQTGYVQTPTGPVQVQTAPVQMPTGPVQAQTAPVQTKSPLYAPKETAPKVETPESQTKE